MFTSDNGTHRTITSQLEGDVEIVGGKGTMPDAGTHGAFYCFLAGCGAKKVWCWMIWWILAIFCRR